MAIQRLSSIVGLPLPFRVHACMLQWEALNKFLLSALLLNRNDHKARGAGHSLADDARERHQKCTRGANSPLWGRIFLWKCCSYRLAILAGRSRLKQENRKRGADWRVPRRAQAQQWQYSKKVWRLF